MPIDPDGAIIEYDENNERRRKERRKPVETETIKTIIIDTNIFRRYGPIAIFQYFKNDVLILESVRDELNHQKVEKIGKGDSLGNCRDSISLFEEIAEKYSVQEIKDGIKISSLAELVFDKPMRTLSTGLLFLRTEDSKNDPFLFSKEFKDGEIISITVKTGDEEKSVSVSDEVALRIRRALWDIQDREIISAALKLQQSGDKVIIITEDKHIRGEARIKGITARGYEHDEDAIMSKNASRRRRPGRITSQRNKEYY